MNKFSLENFKDIPSPKENTKKNQLFFLYKDSDNSTSPKSNSLDSYEPNKCLSNNSSIELKKNFDNYVNSKDIFDIEDSNEANNNINFLGKKTKVSFCITKKVKHTPIFYISKIMKNKDHLFFKKDHNREIRKISQKKKLFQTYNFFIKMIQLKILIEENGHMKNTLNLLNLLLIMEKIGKLLRNMLALEIIIKKYLMLINFF